MNKYFGTDGFRGEVGKELNTDQAYKIGRYLGHTLKGKSRTRKERCKVVIGTDTRLSSPMLECAIASGFAASGVDVYIVGIITTPGLCYLSSSNGFDYGIMITASHNPFTDNGIKIVNSGGVKLDDSEAENIEKYLDSDKDEIIIPFATGGEIGRVVHSPDMLDLYLVHLISKSNFSYKGMRIGLDLSNGASYKIAKELFSSLGAQVYTVADSPDGLNVNRCCGSTNPEQLIRLVMSEGLDVGFAFDGDADRCIAIDRHGEIVDGDAILYILAKSFLEDGKLKSNTVVATVMSNGGLSQSLSELGISTVQAQVGDRFVYEKMTELCSSLGGEQSGHIIMTDYSSTGDGLITAIVLLDEICKRRVPLDILKRGLIYYPQMSESIRVRDKTLVINDPDLSVLADSLRADITPSVRLLIRASGTEPKIRVMAESASNDLCKRCINTVKSFLINKGYAID